MKKSINESLDLLVGQNDDIIARVHSAVANVKFSESMSDKSIELVRMHLGYLKNFTDLAKTRLLYNRYEYLLEDSQNKVAKRGARIGGGKA